VLLAAIEPRPRMVADETDGLFDGSPRDSGVYRRLNELRYRTVGRRIFGAEISGNDRFGTKPEITDVATGGLVIDTGPPPPGFGPPRSPPAAMQPISAQGRLDMWLHGPAGDVNGALLADGTILRFPPPLADQLEGYLIPGQAMRADGWGMATAYGTVVAVQTFRTAAASATAPLQPPGKSTTAPR
jgi:hypothetical protein